MVGNGIEPIYLLLGLSIVKMTEQRVTAMVILQRDQSQPCIQPYPTSNRLVSTKLSTQSWLGLGCIRRSALML